MSESRRSLRKKQKSRKKSWLKRILWIVIFLFLVLLAIAVYMFWQFNDAADDAFQGLDRAGDKSALRNEKVSIGDDPVSILLEGIENYSTGGKNGRADTQIVVTLNPNTNKMTMVSIPRDTKVTLGEEAGRNAGTHKLNSAHAFGEISDYGGNKLQVETVEKLLDIPIDKYIAVDFKGFVDVVNTLGTVQVDVKKPFWEKNKFSGERIYFKEGPASLNGEEALAFVRMRKRAVNNVYPRDERQRQFIKAALREAISAGTIFKVDKITDVLGKHVKTNMSPSEIYGLEKAYSSMDEGAIQTLKLKSRNQRFNGKEYKTLNDESLREVKRKLKQSLEMEDSKVQSSSTDAASETTSDSQNSSR